ncbi:hypothetical protein SLA2020_311570 [Shorea laevis]
MAILRNIKNLFVSIITFIPHSDSPPPPPSSSNIDPESQQPQPLPSPEVHQLASTQLLAAPSSAIHPQSLPRLPPPPADNATPFQAASSTARSSSINRNGLAEHPTSHSITINHQSQQLLAESLIAASLTRQRDQQWESAIISFCFTSAIEISLYKFQQPESNELPFPILLLSCANLFTFALLVVAKLISDDDRLTTISKALQQATIILAFAQLCYTVAIPFTLILKCTVWAIFAISIIVVIIWKYFHF